MSFSSNTKQELCRFGMNAEDPLKDCCAMAELAAIIHGSATLHLLSGGGRGLSISTENAQVARRAAMLMRRLFLVRPQLQTLQRRRLQRSRVYRVLVQERLPVDAILQETGLVRLTEDGPELLNKTPGFLLRKTCCKYAYLRGAFLASGYLADPEKGYHFEMPLADESYAKSLSAFLNRLGLNAKCVARKESTVVYVKDSDQIVTALSMMGASKALLNMESVRVEKEMRNRVNRIVNCDSANIDKASAAGERQAQAILALESSGVLHTLSPALRKMAELRLENPDMPLHELGELFNPPIGKSAVNHRLRKLEELAREMESIDP